VRRYCIAKKACIGGESILVPAQQPAMKSDDTIEISGAAITQDNARVQSHHGKLSVALHESG
jgi:hypothetical protein